MYSNASLRFCNSNCAATNTAFVTFSFKVTLIVLGVFVLPTVEVLVELPLIPSTLLLSSFIVSFKDGFVASPLIKASVSAFIALSKLLDWSSSPIKILRY